MSISIITRPRAAVSDGTFSWTSYWNAINNHIRFTILRADFPVVSVTDGGSGTINIRVTGVIAPATGEYVYVNTATYEGTYAVNSFTPLGPETIVNVDETFVGPEFGGYMNDLSRKAYHVETEVTALNTVTGKWSSYGFMRNAPGPTGLVNIDVNQFAKSAVVMANNSQYDNILFLDKYVTTSIRIKYREVWFGYDPAQSSDGDTYIATHSVKQIRESYGYNLAEHVPNTDDNVDDAYKAKFLCDFSIPIYNIGFPFDIGFLYTAAMYSLSMTSEQALYERNNNLVANVNDQIQTAIGEIQGYDTEARLKLRGSYAGGVKFVDVVIRVNSTAGGNYVETGYVDAGYTESLVPSGSPFDITQAQRVCINPDCRDNGVYLAWRGMRGGWNYWLFYFDQKIVEETSATDRFEQYVHFPITSEGKFDVVGKDAVPKWTLGADAVDMIHLDGMKTLFRSPKVQRLLNPDTWSTDGPQWETVIIDKHKFEYNTRAEKFKVEFEMELPYLNTISQ